MIPTKEEKSNLLFEIEQIRKLNESESCEEGHTSFFHKSAWLRAQPMRRLLAGYTPHEVIRAMQELQSHWYACDCMTKNEYGPDKPLTVRKSPIRAATVLAALRSMREHGYYECAALETPAHIQQDAALEHFS